MKKEKKARKRMLPKAFIKRYGRIIFGGTVIAILIFIAICAPYLTKYDPAEVNITIASQAPSDEHIFGTDPFGRDMYSRIIYGTRVTLIMAFGVQAIVVIFGAIFGMLCGYFKRFDAIVMRIMEALHSIPGILLAMVLAQMLGKGMFKLMIALAIPLMPGVTRMTRSQVLSLRQKEFIESEKAMGANDLRVIFLHILPSCSHYLIIRVIAGFAGTILSTASLSYLGIGLDPNIPNWGSIVADGQKLMLIHPHLIIYPGIAITLTAFSFSLLGEGVREVLDPKLK